MDEHMLTTVDNPFSPVTEYDEWYAWDHGAGYDTPSYLARVVRSSDELSEADQSLDQEQAIDDIVSDNEGFYIKVSVNAPVANIGD